MRNALDKLRALFAWIQGYISPVFVLLLCASFILWYIVKLEYTYNAKYDVSIDIDGERIRVPCYIEGQGSTLLGYRAYMRKQIKISLSELKYAVEEKIDEQTGEVTESYCIIDPQSLQSALSVRLSDVNVLSIGSVPPLPAASGAVRALSALFSPTAASPFTTPIPEPNAL